MQKFREAMKKAEESKIGLLEFLSGQMEYSTSGYHYTTLDFLIQTEQDFNYFWQQFDGDWDARPLMKSIDRLQQHKIDKSRLSWQEFKDLYSFDPQDALETLFMSDCPQYQIDMLQNKLKQGLTLRHVYDTAFKSEGYNFLWGYVSRDWSDKLAS